MRTLDCPIGPGGERDHASIATLTITIDFGDFILPLCGEEWQLEPGTALPIPIVAAGMLDVVSYAACRRELILPRRSALQRAMELAVAAIGGAGPLWLEMEPLRYDSDPADIADAPYVVVAATLNNQLIWTLSGQPDLHSGVDILPTHPRARAVRNLSCVAGGCGALRLGPGQGAGAGDRAWHRHRQ